jgi:hypothetical protein
LSITLLQADTAARSTVQAAADKPTVLQGRGKYRSNLNSARMASNAFSNRATNTGYANAPNYNFATNVPRSFGDNAFIQGSTPQAFGTTTFGNSGTLGTLGTRSADTSFAGTSALSTNRRAFGTPAPRQQTMVRRRFQKNSFSNNGF